jgi:hypothetical protein
VTTRGCQFPEKPRHCARKTLWDTSRSVECALVEAADADLAAAIEDDPRVVGADRNIVREMARAMIRAQDTIRFINASTGRWEL